MNEPVSNNKYFATAKEFRDKINAFFNQTLPKIGDILRGRINDNFQMLNSETYIFRWLRNIKILILSNGTMLNCTVGIFRQKTK